MKSLYLLWTVLLTSTLSFGQIQSVSIQASGLTCSMCSRAIYKALEKVPNVSNVEEDIEHTSYHIQFKDPAVVSLENLKKAVTDAGFSVAWMEVNANFQNVEVAPDSSLRLNNLIFQFVDIHKQNLLGKKKLLVVDRDYLSDKDRKKYGASYQSMPAAEGNGRIFHVTIRQS
jgi:copper chaperone CopZ